MDPQPNEWLVAAVIISTILGLVIFFCITVFNLHDTLTSNPKPWTRSQRIKYGILGIVLMLGYLWLPWAGLTIRVSFRMSVNAVDRVEHPVRTIPRDPIIEDLRKEKDHSQ